MVRRALFDLFFPGFLGSCMRLVVVYAFQHTSLSRCPGMDDREGLWDRFHRLRCSAGRRPQFRGDQNHQH
uniref:Putative secreted protein n=1 Tax=Anopheles darlingi TaxID=43151 RepID=A0A2M4DFQ8_ANODA